jgi:predicted PurR-regulated permease PerM
MNNTSRKPFTLDRIVRIIIGLVILICAGLLVKSLSSVLLPFLVAWLMAYLLYPLMKFYQYKLKLKNRILSIAATLITFLGAVFLAIFILVPPMIDQTQKAFIIIQKMIRESSFGFEIPPAILEKVQLFITNFSFDTINVKDIESVLKEVLPHAWNVVSGAGSIIMNVFVVFMVFLYLVFILKDYEYISENWIGLIPKHYRPFVIQVGEDLKIGMSKYFRGQALIALIVSILFATGFTIINLPLGIVLGLLAGIMNMVPYLQTVTIIPAILLGAIKASEYNQNFLLVAVSVLSVYAIIQVIEDLILTPKIMGNVTGLNPAVILLSLSIWGSLFGFAGMIMALPMTTLLISYYKRFVIKEGFIEKLILDSDETVNDSSDNIKKTGEEEETIDS